jgi:hypothetical protein
MQTSIFIAKLLGPIFIVIGLAGLINYERFKKLAFEFIDSEALIFISGIITLPAGLAIVNTHNVWTAGWPLIITLFGWIAVVAGIVRIALPGPLKPLGRSMIENKTYFLVTCAGWVLLGAFLFYQAYSA